MKNRSAFTIIELVIVILALGILSSIAVPKLLDLAAQAEAASEKAIIAAVQEGIELKTSGEKVGL